MSKLDDRYVEYDLANSINVLPVEHGGTGIGSYNNTNRILTTKATGIPSEPIRIEESTWDVSSLDALTSYNSINGPFEARIQANEAHRLNSGIHVPSGGLNTDYLRGDNTWVPLNSLTRGVTLQGNISIDGALTFSVNATAGETHTYTTSYFNVDKNLVVEVLSSLTHYYFTDGENGQEWLSTFALYLYADVSGEASVLLHSISVSNVASATLTLNEMYAQFEGKSVRLRMVSVFGHNFGSSSNYDSRSDQLNIKWMG